jgi:hypothetical protein
MPRLAPETEDIEVSIHSQEYSKTRTEVIEALLGIGRHVERDGTGKKSSDLEEAVCGSTAYVE